MRMQTARPLLFALFFVAVAHGLAPATDLLSPWAHGWDPSAVAPVHALAAQTLRGTVVRADRTPLPEVDVVIRTETGLVVARATSDSIGRFRLDIDGS